MSQLKEDTGRHTSVPVREINWVNTIYLCIFELISPKLGHVCTWAWDILIRSKGQISRSQQAESHRQQPVEFRLVRLIHLVNTGVSWLEVKLAILYITGPTLWPLHHCTIRCVGQWWPGWVLHAASHWHLRKHSTETARISTRITTSIESVRWPMRAESTNNWCGLWICPLADENPQPVDAYQSIKQSLYSSDVTLIAIKHVRNRADRTQKVHLELP